MYPKTLQILIDELKKLPGVGLKTAERYAFSLLEQNQEEVFRMAQSMVDAKSKLHACSRCGNIAENDLCDICLDPKRNQALICVVQDSKDVLAIEKTQHYTGLYHVLHGVISSAKGIMPDDINIESLMKRLQTHQEIILAINPTIEGEMTSLYLAKRLESKDVSVTRLAHGLPMGSHMDYADELTLIHALDGRKKV